MGGYTRLRLILPHSLAFPQMNEHQSQRPSYSFPASCPNISGEELLKPEMSVLPLSPPLPLPLPGAHLHRQKHLHKLRKAKFTDTSSLYQEKEISPHIPLKNLRATALSQPPTEFHLDSRATKATF